MSSDGGTRITSIGAKRLHGGTAMCRDTRVFFPGPYEGDPAQCCASDPATREKEIEMQQPFEIRSVFKAAPLMLAELDTASLNIANVFECTIDRKNLENQSDAQAYFLIHEE
ncbi:hypothetical protein [Paraburkholderia megapolitana]|nr:hypothetical protein [Paraburkholderia megapolitana]QDQ83741.1 hypothetical protein FNZ07_21520 [Paraburkholderia megapolitana]